MATKCTIFSLLHFCLASARTASEIFVQAAQLGIQHTFSLSLTMHIYAVSDQAAAESQPPLSCSTSGTGAGLEAHEVYHISPPCLLTQQAAHPSAAPATCPQVSQVREHPKLQGSTKFSCPEIFLWKSISYLVLPYTSNHSNLRHQICSKKAPTSP